MWSVFNDAYAILFYEFHLKSICCGYSFELPQLVKANHEFPQHIFYIQK